MTTSVSNMDRWITDTEVSPRFPYYTRANADEVGPEPFSPLGWSLGWMKGCIPGVAEGFVRFGVVRHEEFALNPPEVFGNWGGYFYNQLSLPRTMGVRMPGASRTRSTTPTSVTIPACRPTRRIQTTTTKPRARSSRPPWRG